MHIDPNRNQGRVNLQSLVLLGLLVLGIAIVLLLQIRDTGVAPFTPSPLAKGAVAPNFTLPDLKGQMVSLTDFTGQVVLLNIWATWCPPCVQEMPSMEKLHQTLKNEGFKLITVSVDNAGASVVRPFMRLHKLTFPALINPSASIQNLYHTTGVPESFIIDRQGLIVEKILGPRDWASPAVVRYFRQLMQQP